MIGNMEDTKKGMAQIEPFSPPGTQPRHVCKGVAWEPKRSRHNQHTPRKERLRPRLRPLYSRMGHCRSEGDRREVGFVHSTNESGERALAVPPEGRGEHTKVHWRERCQRLRAL